jgi:hypothetical protein
MINQDQNFLVGEWNLEAISGNVRGDVWWHAKNARSDENAREEQGDDGFGKLKYTCDDDDEINSPKNASKGKKKKEMSVEFEIRLKDVRLVLNERDESANRGGRFFSRAIALSHFLAMKMFLRVFQFVARLCVPSRMELDAAEANRWEFLPPGAESAVVRRAKTGSKGVVVAYSDQPRAFNAKARLWLGALAEKMSTSD